MCEEQTECPLCMEAFDLDDMNFKPCTCGYQICRFCWHRIRTDENGLCPACRKPYSENPAEFKPLTEDDVGKIKKERKQRDQQRKQKAAENRKHLANVRVVQRNLVFVVGLSSRLADPEVLKKPEYFGKFGRIHKVVINQSTAYAGAQGPSASAYVTYKNSDDALRAILSVNNVHYDGRTLKASLGTTKYCSHFLRGSQCPKGDCMYLHELGEDAASFTKEEMQMSKHNEYEQKLIEEYLNGQNAADKNQLTAHNRINTRKKCSSPVSASGQTLMQPPPQDDSAGPPKSATPEEMQPASSSSKDWPSLGSGSNAGASASSGGGNKAERMTNGTHLASSHSALSENPPHASKVVGNGRYKANTDTDPQHQIPQTDNSQELSDSPTPSRGLASQTNAPSPSTSPVGSSPRNPRPHSTEAPVPGPAPRLSLPSHLNSQLPPIGSSRKPLFDSGANSLSLFSASIYSSQKSSKPPPTSQPDLPASVPSADFSDTIPVINSSTDWQAAFGFSSEKERIADLADDDLGFDPCDESFKGLADLIEKENGGRDQIQHHLHSQRPHPMLPSNQQLVNDIRPIAGHPQLPPHMAAPRLPHAGSIPPGFSLSQLQQQQQMQQQAFYRRDYPHPAMPAFPRRHFHIGDGFQSVPPCMSEAPHPARDHVDQQSELFHLKDMQDHLRSLLPNINISFGAPPQSSQPPVSSQQSPPQHSVSPSSAHKGWPNSSTQPDRNWMAHDPAIVSSGNVADGMVENYPHWMDSIHKLTENDTQAPKHRPQLLVPPFGMNNGGWPLSYNPPPGFPSPSRMPQQPHPEPHQISEGLQ